jgi:tetratricopeptide (TPR) repeat protein
MYLWLGGAMLTCVAFVVGTRYRLPAVPVLVIFGALGVEITLLLGRNSGRTVTFERVLAGALLVSGIACSHVWVDRATHNFAEEWVYTGKSLEAEGRLPDAEASYRRAVQADANSEYAWDRLGALLLQSGRRQEGREALATALRLAPGYPDAAYHLGLVAEQEKDFEEAVRYFQRAAASSPGAVNYQQALARTLVSAGRYEEAEKVYSELTARFPNDASSHVGLAFLLNSRGESRRGASEAREAVALDPANETGWLLVARTAIDVGDHAAAEGAIARLRAMLGPNRAEVRYLEEELARAKAKITSSRR